MANNYTPEEIQEVFDEYHRNLVNGIPITRDLAERMKDATTGVKNYTYQLNQSFKQLGSSIKTLGSDIAKGAEGASVFSSTVDSTADVVSNFASKFGLVGKVLGGVVKAGAAYIGAVNKQSDALYKSFQDISKTGTIGAGGMNEVFTSMQKFGYAVDELGQMTSLLAQNSTTLAKFGGTAYDGARALANVSNVLQRGQLGERFRNMGMSVDDINQNAAGYIKTQIALGRNRTDIEKNLTAETAKYIEQVVAVQKLTGQTREQLEEKQAQANREEAFAYTQYELKKRAAAGDQQAAKEYQRNQALSQILEGKAREQFVAGIGGDIAAMGELMQTAPETVQKILTGGDLPSVIQSLAREGKMAVDNLGPLAKFHGFNNFLLPMNELLEIISQYGGKDMEAVMAALEKNAVTVDEATKDQTKMRIAQMNSRQSLENFVNAGIDPVTKAMKILAYAVEYLTDLIPFSGRAKAKYEQEQKDAATTSFSGNQKEFYEKMYNTLLAQATKAGVANPEAIARLGAAQSSLETGYGKSTAAGNNYFGIKAKAGDANASMVNTQEWDAASGRFVTQKAGFRKYGSMEESAADYIRFLQENQRYKSVLSASSAAEAIAAQGRTGYATDPAYAQKLQSIHASGSQIGGAFGFNGSISGPMSGYRPNLLMHGTEQISITPTATVASTNSSGSVIVADMIDKLDDLISIAKNQLYVNEKILKYQQ